MRCYSQYVNVSLCETYYHKELSWGYICIIHIYLLDIKAVVLLASTALLLEIIHLLEIHFNVKLAKELFENQAEMK